MLVGNTLFSVDRQSSLSRTRQLVDDEIRRRWQSVEMKAMLTTEIQNACDPHTQTKGQTCRHGVDR